MSNDFMPFRAGLRQCLRGDGSGTHTKVPSLWPEEPGITAEAESFRDYTGRYISANTGTGACLIMAEEMGAYILTDQAMPTAVSWLEALIRTQK